MAHNQAAAFAPNEDYEDQGRHDYVQTEECANARGKQLLEEQRKVQAMRADPGNELRVRQDCAYDAQAKINVTQFHELPGLDGGM